MALKLFMVLLGSKPKGRHTEQHDIYFGIGVELKDLVPGIIASWPEAAGKIHIDAWREVTAVDGYAISIENRGTEMTSSNEPAKLYFINLGGYKPGEFEEFHYKMLVPAKDKGQAIQLSKATAFYKHTGFEGAVSHVDDKYGVDVDDIEEIEDILPEDVKKAYSIRLSKGNDISKNEWHLGYLKIEKLMAL